MPPSASYGRLMPRGAGFCHVFGRRFQRPPRVGLNPARLHGIRTLAQRLRLSGAAQLSSQAPLVSRCCPSQLTGRSEEQLLLLRDVEIHGYVLQFSAWSALTSSENPS